MLLEKIININERASLPLSPSLFLKRKILVFLMSHPSTCPSHGPAKWLLLFLPPLSTLSLKQNKKLIIMNGHIMLIENQTKPMSKTMPTLYIMPYSHCFVLL